MARADTMDIMVRLNSHFGLNLVFVIVIVSMWPASLWAKSENTIQPRISAGLTYSDNIDLTHEHELEETVLSITPGISLQRRGAKLESRLDYQFSGLFYHSDSDKDDVKHRLSASSLAELYKTIYLDMDANVSQQALDPTKSGDAEGISGSSNLTETYTYGISPYWNKNWDNYLKSQLRFSYNEVKFENDSRNSTGLNLSNDSKEHSATLKLDSGQYFRHIFWSINYNFSETDYDISPSTQVQNAQVTLGYSYSRQLDMRVSTGYEEYDSEDNLNTGINNGENWSAGLSWRPNSRNSLDLDFGRRPFGKSYGFNYKRLGRRINWFVSYGENVVNQRNQIREGARALLEQPQEFVASPIANINSTGLFISKKLSNNFSYSYRKSTINWGLFLERRYFQEADSENEQNFGSSLSWQYNLGKRMTMSTSLNWQYNENADSGNEQKNTRFNWNLSRKISRTLSGNIAYSYGDNNADVIEDEYSENKFLINLSKSF